MQHAPQQVLAHLPAHVLAARWRVLSAEDLRTFQRQLPPVRAQASGWRPAARYPVPSG